MKYVKRYEYDYIQNCSKTYDNIESYSPKIKAAVECITIYDPSGKEIEKIYDINNKRYISANSGNGLVLHNLYKDNNGKLVKFKYNGYSNFSITTADKEDMAKCLKASNDGIVDIFEVAPKGSGPRDISIYTYSGQYVMKIDDTHAYKYHTEHKTNPRYNIFDIVPVIDETYTVVYSNVNDSIYFISETEDEKTVIDITKRISQTISKDTVETRNPFLKYTVSDSNIEIDDFGEPIQINGIYTKETNTHNKIFHAYKYKPFIITTDDYKYGTDLYYVDTIILDSDLGIESKFIRDVYIFD